MVNNNSYADLLSEISDPDSRPGFRAMLRSIVENRFFRASFPDAFRTWYDDFEGDLLDDSYSGAGGSDPQALAPAINAQEGGVVRLVSGDVGGGDDAVDASVLTHSLSWPADEGGLYMEAMVKIDVITDALLFVGFTDVLGTTTVEFPIEISAVTPSGNATNAVGIVFDTAATADVFHGVGVKAGTETALVSHTAGPTAAKYVRLGVEVRTNGSAEFFINGTSIGSVANAVTATVDLTPVIAVSSRTTASRNLDVDYIFVQQNRQAA